METLILNSNSKKDIEIIKEIAKKFGMSIITSKPKNETAEMRMERLLKLAKIADDSILENDITMEEIVEEVRLVREERQNYGKENNS